MDVIPHCFYINLDSRKDRRDQVESELKKVPLKSIERFPAIRRKRGYIGCSMSHVKCMKLAIERDEAMVLICEDDLCFKDAEVLNSSLKTFLESETPWDVIFICGNVLRPVEPHSDVALRVRNCQTTSGYLVANHYYKTLLNNFETALKALLLRPHRRGFRIDMFWKRLQKKDKWFALQPFNAYQRASYSDIERRRTSFKDVFLKVGQ